MPARAVVHTPITGIANDYGQTTAVCKRVHQHEPDAAIDPKGPDTDTPAPSGGRTAVAAAPLLRAWAPAPWGEAANGAMSTQYQTHAWDAGWVQLRKEHVLEARAECREGTGAGTGDPDSTWGPGGRTTVATATRSGGRVA